jgi:hypothetical protein
MFPVRPAGWVAAGAGAGWGIPAVGCVGTAATTAPGGFGGTGAAI